MGGGRRGACRVQRAGRDPQRYVSHRDLAVVPETAGRHREARSAGGFVGRPAPQRPLPPPQAMNTLHELQFAREFKQAVQEAFPELLLALLSQTHYLLELNLPEEPQPGKEAQETALFGPQR